MRTLAALALLTASIALGASRVSGDVVIVEDSTGAPHTPGILGVALPLCAFAAKGLYSFRPDDYDGVVVVTTHPMDTLSYALALTPAGYVVRQNEQGVSQGGFLVQQQPSAYGSAARLSHCVYMGPLRMLPANPDGIFMQPSGPLGGTMSSGMTGIEVLGHEYGHHWLLGVNYDKADGLGPQTLIRADTRMPNTGTGPSTSATLHYSSLADSHSVMWGSFITPLGGGNFKLEGGDRKYGLLDQYLMGLRGAAETPPLLVIDDGTHLGLSGTTLAKGQSSTATGTAVHVEVQDVIRALGARVPAYPNTQHCFRVAFVLATQPGYTATAADIATVDAYRQRFESWFSWATDGRGFVDTRLDAPDACKAVVTPDAGVALPDAGMVAPDAGTPEDAGREDAGVTPPDAGQALPPDAGTDDEGTRKIRPGCGCSGIDASGAWALLGALGVLRRRRPAA